MALAVLVGSSNLLCQAQAPASAAPAFRLRQPANSSVTFAPAKPPKSSAPSSSTAAVIAEQDAIQSLIDTGRPLEEAGRWTEALAHYDKAIRKHHDSPILNQRRTLAHIHVDLDRRGLDDSFISFTSSASRSQTLAALQEICLKIQSHYVDEPNWQRIAWRGTASLDVAVTKDFFRQRYCPRATDEQISDFRHLLRSNVNKRAVRTRSEVSDLANYAAQLAKTQLGIRNAAVMGEYCTGAIASLDSYSTYLTKDQLGDVYSQIDGNFVGLGVELKATEDALKIVKVIRGGPAEKAGMLANDLITAVNGQETETISSERAADLLKGEQGSIVEVRIENRSGTKTLKVTRDRVDVPCVENAGIVDSAQHIAYFKLTSFQKTTSRDVDEALWRLHREGMRSLIIDVRGNPGGLLTASVEVADKFVEDGTIVSTRGRSDREDFDYKAHRVGTWRVPLVVLIDDDTASASEIFAGAIRDHRRGTIVGERSYGKGSVQGIFPLNVSESGVRLTTAKFFSPSGQEISNHGVLPHWPVQSVAKPVVTRDGKHEIAAQAGKTASNDPVMEAALEAARQRLGLAPRAPDGVHTNGRRSLTTTPRHPQHPACLRSRFARFADDESTWEA